MLYFNPHLPCGRRLGRRKLPTVNCDISIHTFLAEGDAHQTESASTHRHFNPHLPCGRRLQIRYMAPLKPVFQSTPSLRKATVKPMPQSSLRVFQSTPSLRKATMQRSAAAGTTTFQSTPSLRKATLKWKPHSFWRIISIHTFLAEGDTQKIGM